jgi:hypothetical protein
MSWVGLADNQIVSFNNLQDAVNNGYFTALTAIPVSNEEITKTDASTYVNCWTGYSLFANKASNQLIAKRDLVTTTSTTTTTTTIVTCNFYTIEGAPSIDVEWLECDGTTNSATVTNAILICAQTGSVTQTGGAGNITQLGTCTGSVTTSTTTTTTTAATTTTTTTSTTTTTTTATGYAYYYVTQYLNCIQNSGVGQYIMRVPSYLDGVTWWCGDDFYQYEFAGNISPDPPTYDVEAINSAISCPNLPC